MSVLTITATTTPSKHPTAARAAQDDFPPRPPADSWEATRRTRQEILAQVDAMPLVGTRSTSRTRRLRGMNLLLDWLADQPGQTWQERWSSSGAEPAGRAWREVAQAWLDGQDQSRRRDCLVEALPLAITCDLVRPSLTWLVGGGLARGGLLVRNLAACRDPAGFTRLRTVCAHDVAISDAVTAQVVYRSALVLAAKGGTVGTITIGDVVELFAAEQHVLVNPSFGRPTFYRVLNGLGIFGVNAPARLRGLRIGGQRTPEELIDRYGLVCGPIRDLLVDYLRERQPALDYTSLDALSYYLGKLFWADIEAHHSGIDSLHLSREVADGWKHRLRTITKTTIDEHDHTTQTTVARINYRECLTPVRAFYLDLAHWAVEDPARWGPWVAPSPVRDEEVNRRKDMRHRKSRMDARTRERLPALPVLVRSVEQRRRSTLVLLEAARASEPGQVFTVGATTLIRTPIARGAVDKIWAHDPATGARRDLCREEDHAFWAWAIVEVLRATGIRIEELLELSHHSLVQYRLPTTGELVPLLQILPSKTDTERLLVVSPELADVLAAIIARLRDHTGKVPSVAAYDGGERLWLPPAPLLFQRHFASENRAIAAGSVRQMLTEALVHTGLVDPGDGQPLQYTPHDFRRMFITDAILAGLPPHIAQIIAGHQDINVTLGYKAVYPDEAITAHLAFLARRRSLRPSEEYRTPTDEEWQEFLGHFERRKVSTGTCARAFGTPCIHEHACVRCPMLWPDPAQRFRLIEIRDNLTARIAEAEREGWLGEVEGLKVSRTGAINKIDQLDQRTTSNAIVDLGIPTRSIPRR